MFVNHSIIHNRTLLTSPTYISLNRFDFYFIMIFFSTGRPSQNNRGNWWTQAELSFWLVYWIISDEIKINRLVYFLTAIKCKHLLLFIGIDLPAFINAQSPLLSLFRYVLPIPINGIKWIETKIAWPNIWLLSVTNR